MVKNLFNRILHKIAYIAPGGSTLRPYLHRLRGVKIGKNVWISQFVYIDELHPDHVTIHDNSSIGLRTTIFTHLYWGGRKEKEGHSGHVVIGKNVYIGPHCVILPNAKIGEGAVVKAGTVVSKNIPPYTFVGYSAPIALGKVTIPLTSEHTYEEFIKGLKPVRNRTTIKLSGTGIED
jgi:acetyltransferase-like isoleucine patch superfamily enzyme